MKNWLLLALLGVFIDGNAQKLPVFSPYMQNLPESEISFEMKPIKGGSFRMGSKKSDEGSKENEYPETNVTVASFWMGSKEVTHDEFQLFLYDASVSQNAGTDAVTRPTPQYIDLSWGMGKEGGFPANSMSFRSAIMYCRWLYEKTGIFYRLPTEAEWEYACRAGTTGNYSFDHKKEKVTDYAWYIENSEEKYHKTGLKKPNAWGLYDMHGNVSEWVLDQYLPDYYTNIQSNPENPVIPPGNTYPKTIRGGSYMDNLTDLRAASRNFSKPAWNKRDPQIPKSKWWLTDAAFVGFRLVRPLHPPTAEEIAKFYNSYLNN